MINALYDAYRVLFKVYSGGAFFKIALSDTPIEELNRAHTVKLCYGVLDRDTEFEYALKFLCDKRPKQSVRIILKEAFYCIKYLQTAPYAVVDNAVELVKKLGKGGNAGFVNAVLRKYVKTQIPLPKEKISALSVKYSYPEFLVKSLLKDYGDEKAEKIMGADEEITAVRFNAGVNGKDYLERGRWNYQETPFENCYIVKGFKRNEDFDKGVYTFQSIGSVAICSVIGGGEKLLDACAAPGGKSVNLADKFQSVTAFELHAHRAELIKDYARRMGKENITVVCRDSTVLDEQYSQTFDAVLCDCPCSGSGVLKDNPDIKLNRKESDILSLNDTQSKILNACSKYVKAGGELYYSTCSVLKAENENICQKFLRENPDFAEEKFSCELPHENSALGVTFLPHLSLGAGFFVCKFRRKS